MRDPARIARLIEKLRAYWLAHPDLRLGQIVVNMSTPRDCGCGDGEQCETPPANGDPFYVEDDRLEDVIDRAMRRGWSGRAGRYSSPDEDQL